MPGQLQHTLIYLVLFGVHLGAEGFPVSRSVQSHQKYPYIASLLTVFFSLASLFFAKWIYLSRRRRKQLGNGVVTKSQTNLDLWDFSSSSTTHSGATSTEKSAFLVGLLGSPSWETRMFDKVSAQLPFSWPYLSSSSPRKQSIVSPEKNASLQKRNYVFAEPSGDALVQPHTALLRCELQDPEPSISSTSKRSLVLDNSTERNSFGDAFSWQFSLSSHPRKSQPSMLYDKETSMRQISGLDSSYKLLPFGFETVITLPEPALSHSRRIQDLQLQQNPQMCLRVPRANQTLANLQTDDPGWSPLTPKVRAGNCDIAFPITSSGFVLPSPKAAPPVFNSEDLSKINDVGTELTGLTCVATQILENTPSFDSTGKCHVQNYLGDQHQLSTEEMYAARPITPRPLKIKSSTKRIQGSPKPGPSPLRTLCLPLDESGNLDTSGSYNQDHSLDNVPISTSPDQSLCVIVSSDEDALPLSSSTLWKSAQSPTAGITPSRKNTNTRPRKRFKTNAELGDKLVMGLLLEELVHETKERDDSLFVNNTFRAMVDSSKSYGTQTHTRRRTNPRASRMLYSSSFSCLEDIPEVEEVPDE